MAKDNVNIPGIKFTGSITVNGPMFDIHDNEHVYINGKPSKNKEAVAKKASTPKPPKTRETMTFQLGRGVLEGHLIVLFGKLMDDGLMEGNEADFKALFSGKRDEECELTWTGKYGEGTLVEMFKQWANEGLVVVPEGYTIPSILEGHFKNKKGEWLKRLQKGDKPNLKALPLIMEYIKLLKLKPNGYIR